MRTLVVAVLLILVSGSGSADLEINVTEGQCPEEFNSLLSVHDPQNTTANPGVVQEDPPNKLSPVYSNQICVSGVEPPSIEDSCPGDPGFYMYSRGTDAHFSNGSVYPLEACTGRLEVIVRSLDPDNDGQLDTQNPCRSREVSLFSISDYTNAHIAAPDVSFYPFKACGSLRPFAPDSVEVRLDLSSDNQIRSDGETLSPGQDLNSFEYPYIASSDGSTVTGMVSRSANTTIRRLDQGQNTMIMTTSNSQQILGGESSLSVLVPLTRGGFESVESRDEAVLQRSLLDTRNPTFGFPNPEQTQPETSAKLVSDIDVGTNRTLDPGNYRLELEKTGEDEVSVYTD